MLHIPRISEVKQIRCDLRIKETTVFVSLGYLSLRGHSGCVLHQETGETEDRSVKGSTSSQTNALEMSPLIGDSYVRRWGQELQLQLLPPSPGS